MTNIFASIRVARLIARSSKGSVVAPRPPFTTSNFSRSTTTFQWPIPSNEQHLSRGFTTYTPWNSRRLTIAQQGEYKANGLCFRCGGKYEPQHKCPPNKLVILEVDNDEPDLDIVVSMQHEQEESDTRDPPGEHNPLQLSELSSHGIISCTVARRLTLHMTPALSFAVILRDGTRVSYQSICSSVPIYTANHLFYVNCNVFPLRNIDVIMGVSWLAQLGDVVANLKILIMEFVLDGKHICVTEYLALTRQECHWVGLAILEAKDDASML